MQFIEAVHSSPQSNSRTFSSSPKKPQAVTTRFPVPQSLGTTTLLSVSMDVLILDTSYKWNRIIYGPGDWHDVFKGHHVVAGIRASFLKKKLPDKIPLYG